MQMPLTLEELVKIYKASYYSRRGWHKAMKDKQILNDSFTEQGGVDTGLHSRGHLSVTGFTRTVLAKWSSLIIANKLRRSVPLASQ